MSYDKIPNVNIALAKNINEETGNVTPANGDGKKSNALKHLNV